MGIPSCVFAEYRGLTAHTNNNRQRTIRHIIQSSTRCQKRKQRQQSQREVRVLKKDEDVRQEALHHSREIP